MEPTDCCIECDQELINITDTSIKRHVKSGCFFLRQQKSELYASEISSVLQKVVDNYFTLNNLSVVEKNKLNRYTKNYLFIIDNFSQLLELNYVWQTLQGNLTKTSRELLGILYRYVMHEIFPQHFKIPTKTVGRYKHLFPIYLKEFLIDLKQ